MNPDNIRRLLALASSFTPTNSPRSRAERDARIRAWQLALEHAGITDHDIEACEHAVIDHYTENTDTLMPAHIISRIQTTRTVSGPLTQDWPCQTCGLGQANSIHQQHTYLSSEPAGQLTRARGHIPELWNTP